MLTAWFWLFVVPHHVPCSTRGRLCRPPLCCTWIASSAGCQRLPFPSDRIGSGGYRHSEVHRYGAERSAEQGGQLATYAVRRNLLTLLRHTFRDVQRLGHAGHVHSSVQSPPSFRRYTHCPFRRRQRQIPTGHYHVN